MTRLVWMMAALLALSLLAAPAAAQEKNVTLVTNQADVREALKALFAQDGLNYTVDPAVQGSVTVSLTNVGFETALRAVLRQVHATYTLEGGVYMIAPVQPPVLEESPGANPEAPEETEPELFVYQVEHADPWLLVGLMRGQWMTQPEISTAQILGGGLGGYGGGGNGYGGPGGGFGGGSTGFGGQGAGNGFGGGHTGVGGGFGQGYGQGFGTGRTGQFGSQLGQGSSGGRPGPGTGQSFGQGSGPGQSGDGWFVDPATNRIYRLPGFGR